MLRRVAGADVRVTALETVGRSADNARLVETYRRGRILLAGDAADIHPPFGGQGLNLGLADAANLGWKLAAVRRGAMPDGLLDTYTAERRPVAEAVLDNTLAQLAIMRPAPRSGAMRDLVATLLAFDDVDRHVGAMMTGLSVRYDLGSDLDDVGRSSGDRPVRIGGGGESSLFDLMQDGRGLPLDASTDRTASSLAAEVAPGVRPDACVAWTSHEEDAEAGLAEALRRWFGGVGSAGPTASSGPRVGPGADTTNLDMHQETDP